MRGLWLSSFSYRTRIYFYAILTAILLLGGMVFAIAVLGLWALLVFLALIWLAMAAITSRLLYREIRHVIGALSKLPAEQPVKKEGAAEDIPATPYFPETPMPSTPLIRVLETIDLSSSDVEHFLAGSAEGQAESASREEPVSQADVSVGEE
ncbi:hypothetical protein EPA93_34870 [Ktedonosporobacter rubrisoli]|uniref:Uncharacterized protein n=1 Tax=Ktedonosporobacter rubrisoli TaxID=2509675 RepID=A0A4P6K0F4_KTERU|nr:hypothetical protein [Ktedonosporobacter rubrisoli]QBD80876.1 hypothetical protein EPA93_34870 [Ktedonosporobacter rubrisoli]